MLKLVSITFSTLPRIPRLNPRALETIECDNPNEQLRGWKLVLRGASAFLVSPGDVGEQRIHEIPRAHCVLNWKGSEADLEDIAKGKAFTSPPFDRPQEPPVAGRLLDKLDPSQIGDA